MSNDVHPCISSKFYRDMKTNICVECSAKITKKKRNYKSQNLLIFCVSIIWRSLAHFGRIIRIIRVETLTFRIRSFFHGLFHIWQSRIFLLSLCQASTLNQPPSGGRKREKRGIGCQAGLDFQTSYYLKGIECTRVHSKVSLQGL